MAEAPQRRYRPSIFPLMLVGTSVIVIATISVISWIAIAKYTESYRINTLRSYGLLAAQLAESTINTFASLNFLYLEKMISDTGKSQDIFFVDVVNGDGDIYLSSEASRRGLPLAATNLELADSGDVALVRHPFILPGHDDEWLIQIAVSLAPLHAERRQAIVAFLEAGLAVLLPVLVVIFFLSKYLTASLSRLVSTAQQMSAGRLSTRAQGEKVLEVDELATAFNQMAGVLERHADELEAKVRERSRELNERNAQLQHTLDQLRGAQDQIIVQEKLASLGAMTAGIAHEIKNPLNFVTNFAELSLELTEELRGKLADLDNALDVGREELEEILSSLEGNLARITEHGKRADSIIRTMLLHSRGKPGEGVATDINALLAESVNLAFHTLRAQDASASVDIETDFDSSLGEIEVIPQDLSRVFLNILNNALHATREKQRALGAGFTPRVLAATRQLNGAVEIRIRDNGVGLPEDIRAKIFEPFFTTKPAGSGTGLGLSISYDVIVQEHRGTIAVDSEEGHFTEFRITLPGTTS
jgi:two-component system NtrC family sensor kinase